MFVLDTNVVSELRKAEPRIDLNVAAWTQSIDAGLMYISTMTLFELELGVRQVERRDGRQGQRLRSWMEEAVLSAFAGRVLLFGPEVALRCAELHVPNPRPMRDSIIAASALVANMTVVTRNVRDFADTGVKLINPWEAQPT